MPDDLPDSPYAAELRTGAKARFSPGLESEYLRSRLLENRTLIRVVCALAAVLVILRGVERILAGDVDVVLLMGSSFVVPSSLLLAWIAWSPDFERQFLPWARVVVPIRNAVGAAFIARTAAQGQPEMLMVLPIILIGPFFFLGLGFRPALMAGILTVAAFVASALFVQLAQPVALRASTFLIVGLIAFAIAARHLESWSRRSFLETRLIAELAQQDALTGVKNRRAFDEHLARLWPQAIDDSSKLAILLIDVDHFKDYNDCYGHQAGDRTLRRVAQTVQAFVRRPQDIIARYGGEEFAALLYGVDVRIANEIADRMRRAVEALHIEHRKSRTSSTVTICVGVAVIEPTRERDPCGALQLADEALYQAKTRGRNRVQLMSEDDYTSLVTGAFSRGVARAGTGTFESGQWRPSTDRAVR
ncbi:diguanylate cyclase [Povalibacter sp.]|uniref:GGDEF domain-containing protein n=1 Tax=Povalibacter sp. TaxID=1962978 RepID=UPI002F3F20B8